MSKHLKKKLSQIARTHFFEQGMRYTWTAKLECMITCVVFHQECSSAKRSLTCTTLYPATARHPLPSLMTDTFFTPRIRAKAEEQRSLIEPLDKQLQEKLASQSGAVKLLSEEAVTLRAELAKITEETQVRTE